jgi:O-antigen/teichoic acid export membrane protein
MDLIKKQGFYNSIVLYAGTALGFFNLIILFQRNLTLEEIGFFSLMNAVALLYAQIASIGINNIILKYFPHYRTDDKRHGGFVSFIIIWCTINFLIFTILFFVFKDQIIEYYKKEEGSALLVRYFYYMAPLAGLTMVYTVMESMAITVFKNILSSFLREVVLRVFTTISILLIAGSLINYHDFLNIYVFANIVMVLVLFYSIYRSRQFKIAPISQQVKSQKKEFVKYGFFTLLSATSFVLLQSLDTLMLSTLTKDLDIIGIYTTFFAIAIVISLPARALGRTSVQIISQAWVDNDLPKIDKIYRKTSVVQMLIGCLLFIGLIVNKQFIIVLLHKPEYGGYFDVFIIVGLAFLTDITGGLNGHIINLSKYYRYTTYFIVGTVGVCALANWILIPIMGMMGAAIAYLIAMFTINFLSWLYVKIKFGLQPFNKAHLLILLISIVALAAGSFMPVIKVNMFTDIANVWVDMVIRSILVLVVYGVLAYLFKVSDDVNYTVNKIIFKDK